MSVGAETDPRGMPAIVGGGDSTAGSPGGISSPGEAGSPAAAGLGDGPPPPDPAGRLLGRLSVLPALLAMAWLLAGLPLLLAGRFTPALMLVVWVPLAALLLYLGLRWVPGRWQSARPGPGPQRARTPWWAVAGVVAVAAAFGAHQLIYHSEQIIVERDPASYIQFGYWIAHHGSLPIPQQRAAFGGTHQLLHFGSLAFYQVAGNVVPQFMAGLPMVLAAGFWAGGVGAAAGVPPLLGACAVLTFGGLAARLTGPRWAPLAALALALSLPEQFTSRSAYSEPLAQILFLGGLCLVIDSLAADGRAARVLAALGGLALGLTLVVRIDGASDILPVIPYCGILLLARRRQAVPLLIGLLAGALYGAVDGLVLSRPYLATVCSVALVLPAAVTSFGLRVATGGPLGVRPVAHGLAVKRTYAGEIAAVNRMCAAIPHRSSVVIIDAQTAAWFAQVVRGMCGEPVAWTAPRPTDVRQVASAIRRAGRRPVLLGAGRSQVAPYGPAREVLALRTREDARLRTAPPLNTRPRPIAVWMTEPER